MIARDGARREGTLRRKRDILTASLECYTEQGLGRISLESIRARSRSSTGSIYHHFSSKQQLLAELYLEGLRDYQQGFVRALHRYRTTEQGVRGIVRYHLGWVAKHPDWARYLIEMGHAEAVAATAAEIRELNRSFLQEVGQWFAPRIERGELIRLPMELYTAVLTGPSQLFARHWLSGRSRSEMARARRELAEAAWRSLRPPKER